MSNYVLKIIAGTMALGMAFESTAAEIACNAGFGAAVGKAQARVGIFGGHLDYNLGIAGGKLLPIGTTAKVSMRTDDKIYVTSMGKEVTYKLGEEKTTGEWSDYIEGITQVLREDGIVIPGSNIEISSTIPMGAGISSSAALTMAVFKGLREAYGFKRTDDELAFMGQRVEAFTGARTGTLDQKIISNLADDLNAALVIDFKTNQQKKVAVPEYAEWIVIHSGMTHSLKDSHGTRNYATRRAECEGACEKLGIKELGTLTPEELEKGRGVLDPLTYKRAHYVVHEGVRAKQFVQIIQENYKDRRSQENQLLRLGALMKASHQAMKEDYDISEPPIDALVDILNSIPGVYGAQLTGGGFGGSVTALVRKEDSIKVAKQALEKYNTHPANGGQFKGQLLSHPMNEGNQK